MILFVAAAWAGAVPTGAAPQAVFAPRRVAVVIGVQDYADPALQGLRFPRKDAEDMGMALASPDVGGFDHVTVIDTRVATTRAALLTALKTATADLQRDDTFLLYLSGHGTLTLDPLEGSRLWFLPSDARLDAPSSTGLAVADLESLVNALPARRRVLILDTCHNGRTGSKSSMSSTTSRQLQGLRGDPPAPRDERAVSESEARLFAAQYYQPAMEDPDLQNGVYTHFLLEALTTARSSADLDGDALVDVGEAHNYARDHTIAYTGGLQVPRAEYREVGREAIYLSGKATERSRAELALVTAYDRLLERTRLLVNGTPRGVLPGLYALDPGVQTIEVQTEDGRRLLKERVRLEAGERVAIERLVHANDASLSVLGGGSWTAGTELLHPVHAGVELVWARPFRTSSFLRPDLHLGVEGAHGPLPSGVIAGSGNFSVGGTLGLGGAVWTGPGVDLRVPFRWYDAADSLQGEAAVAGLWSLGGAVPLTDRTAFDLRLDAGVTPLVGTEDDWLWSVGLRAGVRFGL
jgi:hypothetical protein